MKMIQKSIQSVKSYLQSVKSYLKRVLKNGLFPVIATDAKHFWFVRTEKFSQKVEKTLVSIEGKIPTVAGKKLERTHVASKIRDKFLSDLKQFPNWS